MKFNTSTSEMQKALSRIIAVVPSKSTLPILENILFELSGNNLKITATDLEISMTVNSQVNGTTDGKIAIPARRLTETIRALPELDISFHADASNRISLTTDMGEYKMSGNSSDEFPIVPELKDIPQLEIEGESLRRLIATTLFAISTDELRPSMMGVLFQIRNDEFRVVSTDGHRLVKIVNQNLKSVIIQRDIIIPAKALHLVLKSIDGGQIKIAIDETRITFDFGNAILVSQLIDETYPNYESVIPLDNEKKLVVNREGLLSSVRRVSLYSSSATHQIRFSIGSETMTVSAEDVDIGGEAKEVVACKYDAEPMEIGFNSKYVEDALSHIDDKEVMFKFSSPTRAGILQPLEQNENEEVLMLVMPVRLND